jgi:hypothetical protein
MLYHLQALITLGHNVRIWHNLADVETGVLRILSLPIVLQQRCKSVLVCHILAARDSAKALAVKAGEVSPDLVLELPGVVLGREDVWLDGHVNFWHIEPVAVGVRLKDWRTVLASRYVEDVAVAIVGVVESLIPWRQPILP